ncbi:MFS transporter [Isoptericola cucumis]|uniref:MFS transporter n=1 Tax=Isoptericola cucumis TaxID=1776856 RepID=A0ABQ2B6Q0_9MICO|nr:MFS transporter [Isoptericola cucumis]GGI08806.1 MFS transporter [Isoptericola cucumis]
MTAVLPDPQSADRPADRPAARPAARRAAPGRRRRLRVSDVTVVDGPMLKKTIGGTVVGNFMEWYDVGVYGYLAVVMGAVFLPTASSGVQILFSLGVFASTYVARPLGGIICGRIGDRIGRQKVLSFTLIMMAASTFLIGLLPTYDTIGAVAPLLLVLLKLLQGFSTGGEYAGVTTFVVEHAPDRRRGWAASFLDFGTYVGFAAGAVVVTVLQVTLGEQAVLDGAWRIPFLVAGPIGAFAVWFRLKIEETPAFQAQQAATEQDGGAAAAQAAAAAPTLRSLWKPLAVAMVLVAVANTASYVLTSYMPTYLTDTLGYDAVDGTLLTVPVLVLLAGMILVAGPISDRVGRRPLMWFGTGSMLVLSVPAFALLAAGHVWSTLLGLSLMAVPVASLVGVQAATLPAMFPTAVRYRSMGLAYNVALAVFGGTTPLIVEALTQATGSSLAPAYYVMAFAVVGAVTVFFLRESAGQPLPGAMPAVDTDAEAAELVATQDENPNLDVETLPLHREPAASGAH